MNDEGPKHFNRGNVWGVVKESARQETAGGTPYLNLKIDASGGVFGPAVVYGRMFGEKEIDKAEDLIRKNDGKMLRFEGMLTQYVQKSGPHEGNLRTAYVFFNAREAGEQMPRASFVLVGKVEELSREQDLYLLRLRIRRDHQPEEELFIIRITALQMRAHPNIAPGVTAEFQGVVERQENVFGGTGELLPYSYEGKVRGRKAADSPSHETSANGQEEAAEEAFTVF